MRSENILQTLQRYATIAERLEAVAADQPEFEKAVVTRLDDLTANSRTFESGSLGSEASRAADRAEMQADIARFKAEVERAEIRLTRLLPPSEDSS